MTDIENGKYGSPITSDYVFDETVTVSLRKSGKKDSITIGNFIIDSEIQIIIINNTLFQSSWELFQKTENMSFTDCTNISVMNIVGNKLIATFDKDFKEIKSIEIVDS